MPKYFYAEIIKKKLCSQTKNIMMPPTLSQSQPLFSQKENSV